MRVFLSSVATLLCVGGAMAQDADSPAALTPSTVTSVEDVVAVCETLSEQECADAVETYINSGGDGRQDRAEDVIGALSRELQDTDGDGSAVSEAALQSAYEKAIEEVSSPDAVKSITEAAVLANTDSSSVLSDVANNDESGVAEAIREGLAASAA